MGLVGFLLPCSAQTETDEGMMRKHEYFYSFIVFGENEKKYINGWYKGKEKGLDLIIEISDIIRKDYANFVIMSISKIK